MAKPARKVLVVRFKRESPNIEGSTRSFVSTEKRGFGMGYTVTETDRGVELSKEGVTPIFVPWSGVLQVEYADG